MIRACKILPTRAGRLQQGRDDGFFRLPVYGLVRHRGTGQYARAVRLVLSDPARPDDLFPVEAHCSNGFFDEARGRISTLDRQGTAEISRFAVSKQFRRRLNEARFPTGLAPGVIYADRNNDSHIDHRRALPHITIGLFAAIVQLSVAHGVTDWYAVMEPTLLRLLRRFGIRFPAIGHDVDYHGVRRPTLAAASDVLDGIRAERPDV